VTTPTPQQVLEAQLSEDRWERERELRHFAPRESIDSPDVRDLPDLSSGQSEDWPQYVVPR